MGKENAIEVIDISKKFGNFQALKDVSFAINKNTIFGLLGSNGAGKSTLLHIIMGLLEPSKGEVLILGEKVKTHSKFLKRNIAIVPQKISLYEDMSIFDNIYFFGSAYGLKKKEILSRIEKIANVLNLGDLNRKIKFLSGGYQRRVSIAVGLIGDPKVLVLDEATVGIDFETRKIIIDLLLELKSEKTIIITTHSLSEAEQLCEYVCFLHKGEKVLEGDINGILENFATKKKGKIMVKFSSPEICSKVAETLFSKGGSIIATTQGAILKIVFSSDVYTSLSIINLIQGKKEFKENIINIEISKPSLEDVITHILK
jgi:ABC-2 type transport system ATP-binding protein